MRFARGPRSGESGASRTAVLVCQGRAVVDGRYSVGRHADGEYADGGLADGRHTDGELAEGRHPDGRYSVGRHTDGRFSDPVARHLLTDPERDLVDRIRSGAAPDAGRGRMEWELVRRTAVTMVPRTVAIDAAVRAHGASQVVVLGAGLDDRAWRMASLADAVVLEVDHPASQSDKRRRVEGLPPVAGRVVLVAVDLAVDPLGPALLAAGFEPDVPTTWLWEGVVPYLTREAVGATAAEVARLSAPGSRLVVSYQRNSFVARLLRRLMRVVAARTRAIDPLAGEPWRSTWKPRSMGELLSRSGFDVMADDSLLDLADGMQLPREARGSLRNGRIAVVRRR